MFLCTAVSSLPRDVRTAIAHTSFKHIPRRRAHTASSSDLAPKSHNAIPLPETQRAPKKPGTIEDVFSTSLSDVPPLPQRFSELKRGLFREELVQSWNEVLHELKNVTEEVGSRGQDVSHRDLLHYWQER